MALGSYGVVFSGGGALGAWEVGCLDRLVARHDDAYPKVVVGASAGAINAAAVASGLSVADLIVAWTDMKCHDVFDPNPRGSSWRSVLVAASFHAAFNWSIPAGLTAAVTRLQSLFNASPLEKTFTRLLASHWDRFSAYEGALAIAVTNLAEKGRRYYYHPERVHAPGSEWHPIRAFPALRSALMASAAIPVVFEPRNNEVDGGVLHNQPLAAAHALLSEGDPIYVLVPHADDLPAAVNNLAVLTSRLIATWMSQGFRYELSTLAMENVSAVAAGRPPRPVCEIRAGRDLTELGSGLLRFGSAVAAIMDRGREDTDNALRKFRVGDESTWPIELARGMVAARAQKSAVEANAQASARSIQSEMAARIGYKAERIEASSVVVDLHGNSIASRKWTGLQVSEGHAISFISGSFWVSTPGGEVPTPGRLVSHSATNNLIRLVEEDPTPRNRPYRVEFTKAVTPQDSPLNFEVQADYSRAVLMSASAVAAAYAGDVFKYDYATFDVEIPVEELVLTIEFPEGVAVQTFPMVFFGWTEQAHGAELRRTEKGFTRTARGGRFVIREPLLTFRYAIYWTFDS